MQDLNIKLFICILCIYIYTHTSMYHARTAWISSVLSRSSRVLNISDVQNGVHHAVEPLLCNWLIWNKQCFAIKHGALLIVVVVRFYSSIIKRLSYFLNITHTGGNGAFVGDYFYPWITSNLVLWWDSVCGIQSKTTTVCVLMVMNVSQSNSVTQIFFC